MGFKYLDTGKDCYSLRSACQDMYLTLKMNEAMENPYTIVKTEDMPWK